MAPFVYRNFWSASIGNVPDQCQLTVAQPCVRILVIPSSYTYIGTVPDPKSQTRLNSRFPPQSRLRRRKKLTISSWWGPHFSLCLSSCSMPSLSAKQAFSQCILVIPPEQTVSCMTDVFQLQLAPLARHALQCQAKLLSVADTPTKPPVKRIIAHRFQYILSWSSVVDNSFQFQPSLQQSHHQSDLFKTALEIISSHNRSRTMGLLSFLRSGSVGDVYSPELLAVSSL